MSVETGHGLSFTMIPLWVLQHPELSSVDVRVYLVLHSYLNAQTGAVWPSVKTIAEKAGVGVRTVGASRKHLEAVGAIQVEERKRANGTSQTNVYRFPATPVPYPAGAAGYPAGVAPLEVEEEELEVLPKQDIPSLTPSLFEQSFVVEMKEEHKVDNEWFEKVWQAYPRHERKAEARVAMGKLVTLVGRQPVRAALHNYLTVLKQNPQRPPMHLVTFLRADRWEDWVEGIPEGAAPKPEPVDLREEWQR